MSEWFFVLQFQLGETPFLYWMAIFSGACHVFLAKANSIWLYPVGILMVSVMFYNMLGMGHYAGMACCAYYLVMFIYGWLYWSTRRRSGAFPVTYANHADWIIVLLIVIGSFIVLYFMLDMVMGTLFPVWQASIGAAVCAGVWLLNNRKIENWVLFNLAHAASIPLMFYTGQVLYGVLAFLLYIFAFIGFFSWRRMIRQQHDFLRP